jgi:hypothetical protein
MTETGKWRRDEIEAYGRNTEEGIHGNRSHASNEAGQILLLVALGMVVLIGSVALAVDVGYLRYMKRNMQKAADAAAIAGAAERIYNVGNIGNAARTDASKNGFTDGTDGVSVTVNRPPNREPYQSRPDPDNYVEVIIDQEQPTFFAKVFNIASSPMEASAVAYAGTEAALGCVDILDPTASHAFAATGGANVIADCGIYVNSNDADAALFASGGARVTANGVSVRGGASINGNVTQVGSPLVTGASPVSDPLAYLQAPTFGGCNHTNYVINASPATLFPGVYCGGIRVQGNNRIVNFMPGTYILNGGGLRATANGTTLSSPSGGVTFYNTGTSSGGVTRYGNIDINARTTLAAPTSGGYAGILFWQDPNWDDVLHNDANFNGPSPLSLEGALYFPKANLTWNGGNSTSATYTIVVANQVQFAGNATFNIKNKDFPSGTRPPPPKIVLVE